MVTTWRQGLAWPLLVTRVLPCHADTGQQGSQGGLAPCEEGVLRALDIVRREADTSMALMGERDIRNIGPHNIYSNELARRQGY